MIVLSCINTALSQEIRTSSYFDYPRDLTEIVTNHTVYSVWNARELNKLLSPGMKVAFFGGAANCIDDAADGPTTDRGNKLVSLAGELTGIAAGNHKAEVWTPSGNTEQCIRSARTRVGNSFVLMSSEHSGGGLGLFTYTGRDKSGQEPFFSEFPARGQNSTGVNAFIEGTFVIFRFDSQSSKKVALWPTVDPDETLEFKSTQSVVQVDLDSGPKSVQTVQVKQQMMFTVINRACSSANDKNKKICQIQYLLNVAVYRSGVNSWATESWFQRPSISFDAAQGGIPVVNGPIPILGSLARESQTGLELYSSHGAASQHSLFSDKEFTIGLSFLQLQNALRATAAIRFGRDVKSVGDSDLLDTFGARWNDPREWSLLDVSVGQEVFNPLSPRRAFIGGNVKTLSVSLISRVHPPEAQTK